MVPALSITIEVAELLEKLAGDEVLNVKITDRVQTWLDDMAIPAQAQVTVVRGLDNQGPRFLAFAVLLNGHRCPISRELIVRVHDSAVAGTAEDFSQPSSGVRSWLQKTLEDHAEIAFEFLAELALESIKASSDHVVRPEVARAVLNAATPHNDRAQAVFRSLLRLGISLRDRDTILDWLLRGQAAAWTADRIAERLYDVLRPDLIEIRLDPAALARLVKDEASIETEKLLYPNSLKDENGDMVALMCDGLFYEFGVYFTRIAFVADDELPDNSFRFRLNDQLTPIRSALGPDEIMVNATVEAVGRLHEGPIRPRINPANGNPCAVVKTDAEESVEKEGFTTWTSFGYLILALAADLRRAAGRLLSLSDVENSLAKTHELFPTLVAAVYAHCDPLLLTFMLRRLLQQGVSIRDLRTILGLVLDFRYTTGIRSPTSGWQGREPYVYLGAAGLCEEPYFTESDPYVAHFDMSPFQLATEPPPSWKEDGKLLAEFVKCGLRTYVTHKISHGQNTIICYIIDPDIEQALLANLTNKSSGQPPFDQKRLNGILSGMAGEIERLSEDYKYLQPVVFIAASPDVALQFDEVFSGDFPELFIVHRQMIENSANVQPVGQIPGLQTMP